MSARYRERHADAYITLSEAEPGIWCKAAAVMPAVRASTADVIAVADADVWAPGLAEAVQAVVVGTAWAMPHIGVFRLTERATERFMCGAALEEVELERRAYAGVRGGGVVVARPSTLLDVPMDSRFAGWGNEDEAWGMALWTLFGPPHRVKQPLVHLWHPPAERQTLMRGSDENWALRERYRAAMEKPEQMRALLSAQPKEIRMEFRCRSNPNFRLRRRGIDIAFTDGTYETERADEIRALSDSPFVEVADTKAELVDEAEQRGVDVESGDTRDEIVDGLVDDYSAEAERTELE